MSESHNCISCGMTMTKSEDFGGGTVGNSSCVFCSNEDGSLKSRNVVREGMIQFWAERESLNRAAAEKFVDDYMAKMPAWKKK